MVPLALTPLLLQLGKAWACVITVAVMGYVGLGQIPSCSSMVGKSISVPRQYRWITLTLPVPRTRNLPAGELAKV